MDVTADLLSFVFYKVFTGSRLACLEIKLLVLNKKKKKYTNRQMDPHHKMKHIYCDVPTCLVFKRDDMKTKLWVLCTEED